MSDSSVENKFAPFEDVEKIGKKPHQSDDNEGVRPISPADLQGLEIPKREWLVEDWIPKRTVTSIYGDGGTGKSLLMMQLMTAAGLDRASHWLGLPVTQSRCFGFFCEDEIDEIWRRQEGINRLYGCDFKDLNNISWLSGAGNNNILMDFETDQSGRLTSLYYELEEAILKFQAQTVIIDTAAETFGGNEISRNHVTKFVGVLRKLAQRINGPVILCAHPSQAGRNSGKGDSGSSAWNNSVRSRLYLEMDNEDNNARILHQKKTNYGPHSHKLDLIWEDGGFKRRETEGQFGVVGAIEKRKREKHQEEIFLNGLKEYEKQGRPLSSSKNSGNYAPKKIMLLPCCAGQKKPDMENAMERLFQGGAIKVETYGRGKNSPKKIVQIRELEQ